MHCGGTQTRRRQERHGTPEGGAARRAGRAAHPLPGCPAPLLPSPGLRSDPAQGNKRSPMVSDPCKKFQKIHLWVNCGH